MPERRAVHADLMRSSGVGRGVNQRDPGARSDRQDVGHGVPPRIGDPHYPLSSGEVVALEGQRHPPTPSASPDSSDERRVPLVEGSPAQRFVQGAKRAAALRDDEASRRIPIQPVNELEIPGRRTRGAQQLDHSERDAASAMNGAPGRLVQDEDAVIFVQDRTINPPDLGGRRADPLPSLPKGIDGRDSDRFSGAQTTARARP